MKRLCGKLEPLVLLICGAAILKYAFSGSYGLLMNPRFKWLTVTGSTLLVILGLTALTSSAKRPKINIIVFSIMFLIVLLGRPYLPSAAGTPGMEPEPDAGLLAEVDLQRFPRVEFQYIFKESQSMADLGKGFTITGTAKRLEQLDDHGSFAIMTSVMYCCLADIFATGYRVAYEDWSEIKDGQPLLVSGTFVEETIDFTIPNFKFGRSMFSSVNKELFIKPDQVLSYNRLAELPPLTGLMDGENVELFTTYLKATGLWDKLGDEGPFTVFIPVDKAIQALGEERFENMPPETLKDTLELHVVPGRLFTPDLMKLDSVESLNGSDLNLNLKSGRLTIEGSRYLLKNMEARNGVLHFIYPAMLKEGGEDGKN
jgi:hypothetical protein